MKLNYFAFIIGTLLIFQLVESTTIELPVSQATLVKINLSIKYLEEALQKFGTILEDRLLIYKRVQLCKIYLLQLKTQLMKYNNVIAGIGNSVNGKKNIVIGNFNNVEGSNNWIFVSKYSGNISGNLVIGKWRIELKKSSLILINPRFAISFINETQNQSFKQSYVSSPREMCKWDKWTNPRDPKADAFWKNFKGYNDWKKNHPGQRLTLIETLLSFLKPLPSKANGLAKL